MSTPTQPPLQDPDSSPTAPAGKIPRQAGTPREGRSRAFTSWVVQLSREDPGARSALRSGLRKDLDSVRRMHRLVAPWLPESRSEDMERAYYAVAAMIAAQPRSATAVPEGTPESRDAVETPSGTARRRRASLGTAFAAAVTEGPGREKEMRTGTAESRLNLLTRQSVNGLHRHLPGTVGYLCSVGVDVDWAQILDDLGNWRKASGRISRTWLQDFYRARDKDLARQADEADEQELAEEAATAPTAS
ncbi:type I-E CRISPR-associated protein Cse2/CasB [Streptomyces sp. NPDC048332]|uniref:type I-E CRISPR-associated protein Cse2/CasB n=1 Tax=Streptomyces sp. NPDC048332 TaxID=3154619 RepID=UPI0034205C0F